MVAGTEDGQCPPGAYAMAIAATKWSFMACGPPKAGEVTAYTPAECLARCERAWAIVQRTESEWACTCLSTASCLQDKCGPDQAVFYHQPLATGRRRRSQTPLGGRIGDLCPAPMEACAVGKDGYECIDTRSELGGCPGPQEG